MIDVSPPGDINGWLDISYQVWSYEGSTFFQKGPYFGKIPGLENLTHMCKYCDQRPMAQNGKNWLPKNDGLFQIF